MVVFFFSPRASQAIKRGTSPTQNATWGNCRVAGEYAVLLYDHIPQSYPPSTLQSLCDTLLPRMVLPRGTRVPFHPQMLVKIFSSLPITFTSQSQAQCSEDVHVFGAAHSDKPRTCQYHLRCAPAEVVSADAAQLVVTNPLPVLVIVIVQYCECFALPNLPIARPPTRRVPAIFGRLPPSCESAPQCVQARSHIGCLSNIRPPKPSYIHMQS